MADAAQAIVDEAMSAASKAERRIAPTEVRHILEGIDRGVISFEGNRIRFVNDPLRVCSLFALNLLADASPKPKSVGFTITKPRR